jgi:hypothetical protein
MHGIRGQGNAERTMQAMAAFRATETVRRRKTRPAEVCSFVCGKKTVTAAHALVSSHNQHAARLRLRAHPTPRGAP